MGFVYVAVPFLLRLELLPSSPGSGITALKKCTLRNAFLEAWDRKFAEGGKSKTPSGMKRQQAAVCLPAFICFCFCFFILICSEYFHTLK